MNEHLLAELPVTFPQHERRIITDGSDENALFTYCTICAWSSDQPREWSEHLDEVVAHHRANPNRLSVTDGYPV